MPGLNDLDILFETCPLVLVKHIELQPEERRAAEFRRLKRMRKDLSFLRGKNNLFTIQGKGQPWHGHLDGRGAWCGWTMKTLQENRTE